MEEDNECCGIMGRLFGHNYQSIVEFYTPAEDIDKKILSIITEFKNMKGAYWEEIMPSMNRTVDRVIEASASKQYKIVCRRCGKGLPNSNGNDNFMVKVEQKDEGI